MVSDSVFIRGFNYTDLPMMAELEKSCFPPLQAFSEDVLFDFITGYRSVTLLLFGADEKLLGFVIFSEIHKNIWELITIDINPGDQSKGLGKRLLPEALEKVEKEEPVRVILHVAQTNYRAISLYKKFGFCIVKPIQNYYNDGQNAYLMCKEYRND